MPQYIFENISCGKPAACDEYVRANNTWINDIFSGLSTGPLTIYTSVSLSEEQLALLTVSINNYVDPLVYLSFDHTNTMPLYSTYTTDTTNIIVDNKHILQTFIYNNSNSNDTNIVLDGLKTVVEYYCPNVQNFLNITSGNINLEIYDITRNVSISSKNIELNNIALEWNSLAQTGSTEANTVYKTTQYNGLMNASPNHDVILQLRGNTNIDDFTFRCNSLQFLYYNKQ